MSQAVRQDWAIPLPVMHALMKCLDREWSKAIDQEACILVASVGAYAIIAFYGSFRGSKVFLIDLHGLQKYLFNRDEPEQDFVIIPLLGRFKGETGDRYHLTPLASKTSLGLKVKEWVK